MRKTIYFSKRSKGVYDFVNSLEKQDISHEVVKLMEDGLRMRKGGHISNEPKPIDVDFSSIKTTKVEVQKDVLEGRLDSL